MWSSRAKENMRETTERQRTLHRREILMKYQWFHQEAFHSGSYHADQHTRGCAKSGGACAGRQRYRRLHVDFHSQTFRAETKARGHGLKPCIAAEEQPQLADNSPALGSRSMWTLRRLGFGLQARGLARA